MTTKQFSLLSIAGSIASLIGILLWFWPQPESSKQRITGETHGINSPIINSQGGVSLNFGMNPPTSEPAGSKSASSKGNEPTQQITGNDNIQIGSIKGDVTINPKPKIRTRTVLQNAGSNVALVLKEIDEDPKMLLEYATDEDKRLGLVPVGTEVEVLPEKRKFSKNPAMASYTKVKLLEGDHKGQVGWASVSNIKSETVAE